MKSMAKLLALDDAGLFKEVGRGIGRGLTRAEERRLELLSTAYRMGARVSYCPVPGREPVEVSFPGYLREIGYRTREAGA